MVDAASATPPTAGTGPGVKFPGAVRQVDPRGAQRKVAAKTGEQHGQGGGDREGHDVGVHAILARPRVAGSCTE